MINFNHVTEENKKAHNPNWHQILDHLHRILTIGGSGSGKKNAFFSLTTQQGNFDKIYSYTKDKYEAKY